MSRSVSLQWHPYLVVNIPKKMNNNCHEFKSVPKVSDQKSEPKTVYELFSEENPNLSLSETVKHFLETECSKHVQQALDQRAEEHRMCMKERQASINTSHAITGAIATWVVIGVAMLGKTCINFDKGPKFKV